MQFHVNIHEIPVFVDKFPFEVKVLPMLHRSYCVGIRLVIDKKIISYCPDTGYCENCIELAKDADFLITECAFPSGFNNPDWPHLNPETAAKIANEANAKELILTHFDAEKYANESSRNIAQKAAQKTFKNTIAARDEMIIQI